MKNKLTAAAHTHSDYCWLSPEVQTQKALLSPPLLSDIINNNISLCMKIHQSQYCPRQYNGSDHSNTLHTCLQVQHGIRWEKTNILETDSSTWFEMTAKVNRMCHITKYCDLKWHLHIKAVKSTSTSRLWDTLSAFWSQSFAGKTQYITQMVKCEKWSK